MKDARRIGADRHAGKRALQHGGEQRGAKSLAGNVGDQKRGALRRSWETRRSSRRPPARHGVVDAANGQMRKIAEAARQQRLLNVARDAQFLLEALALALALHQTRVVQNAGGFDGQGVQNLAIEFGKGRRASRIEIQNAQKLPALHA